MPVKKVSFINGEIYHIFNRGTDKRVVFENKQDFFRFYLTLDIFNSITPTVNFEFSRNTKLSNADRLVYIHAYALLPNHFHLLIEQRVEGGISEFIKRVSTGYTSYFNDRRDRSGVLFQGKFKRVHVETDEQYQYLLAYINENYIVHNLPQPDGILYSSSSHYSKNSKSRLVLREIIENYDRQSASALAINIFNRRKDLKRELFE